MDFNTFVSGERREKTQKTGRGGGVVKGVGATSTKGVEKRETSYLLKSTGRNRG